MQRHQPYSVCTGKALVPIPENSPLEFFVEQPESLFNESTAISGYLDRLDDLYSHGATEEAIQMLFFCALLLPMLVITSQISSQLQEILRSIKPLASIICQSFKPHLRFLTAKNASSAVLTDVSRRQRCHHSFQRIQRNTQCTVSCRYNIHSVICAPPSESKSHRTPGSLWLVLPVISTCQ
jgi:hypothetical protein